jgi:hypothetical protein
VPGFYVQERLSLPIPPGTPPGVYPLHVGVYLPGAGETLSALDSVGNPLESPVVTGQVTITRPRWPARTNELGMAARLESPLTADLTLLGVTLPVAEGEAGGDLPLTTYWRAQDKPEQDYSLRLLWLDAAGETAAVSPDLALTPGYPTSQWARRAVLASTHRARIPAVLGDGVYTLALQLVNPAGETVGARADLGQIAVDAPPRMFTAPEPPVASDAVWENGIRLLGFDPPPATVTPEDVLTLALYWQPSAEIVESLLVSASLIDEEGNTVVEQTQIPASGARPTTGWAPGEIIADPYVIHIGADVPPGRYWLRIGWYNPATGAWVPLVTSEDGWRLPPEVIVTAR